MDAQELVRLAEAAKKIEAEINDIDGELIQVSAKLKASDVGIKQDQLRELVKLQQMYAADSEQWRDLEREIRELTRLVDDMQNDRKPYSSVLKEARAALKHRLMNTMRKWS